MESMVAAGSLNMKERSVGETFFFFFFFGWGGECSRITGREKRKGAAGKAEKKVS